MTLSPSLLFLYLSHRGDEQLCSKLWQGLLSNASQGMDVALATLPALLDGAQKGSIPSYLEPDGDVLDSTVSLLLADALTKHQAIQSLDIVGKILKHFRKTHRRED